MKTSKGYLFRACYNKRANHHLCLVETQIQAREVGKLYNMKNGIFRYALIKVWHKEARVELSRNGASYVIGL